MMKQTCVLIAMMIAAATSTQAQSTATVINPSEVWVQWNHSGDRLQYFDYWVDNVPRKELGTYEKVDATTYRHKLPPDLANGAHTVQVRACNLTLPKPCTDWIVLSFTVDRAPTPTPILGVPTNLTIITIGAPTERKSTPR